MVPERRGLVGGDQGTIEHLIGAKARCRQLLIGHESSKPVLLGTRSSGWHFYFNGDVLEALNAGAIAHAACLQLGVEEEKHLAPGCRLQGVEAAVVADDIGDLCSRKSLDTRL